jgi:hypothetical protein
MRGTVLYGTGDIRFEDVSKAPGIGKRLTYKQLTGKTEEEAF